MDAEQNSRAVRVGGELLVLHCWACGTAHCVNQELCVPGELSHMVCSNSKCKMSMFLVNELAVEDEGRKRMRRPELNERKTHSRFWK
jgi:translation initiation factor 2 beta subunit (eIF-2beta)/eIF-5